MQNGRNETLGKLAARFGRNLFESRTNTMGAPCSRLRSLAGSRTLAAEKHGMQGKADRSHQLRTSGTVVLFWDVTCRAQQGLVLLFDRSPHVISEIRPSVMAFPSLVMTFQ